MPGILNFRTVITTLVLIALGYVALWYTVGFRTQRAVATTLASWLNDGLRVKHGDIRLSGFPYRLVIEIDDLDVRTRSEGLAVQSDQMTLISHLWTPDHWVIQSAGNQIDLAGGSISLFEEFLQASYRLHNEDKLVVKIDSAGASDMRLRSPAGLPSLSQWSLLIGKDYGEAPTAGGLYEKRTLEFRFYADADGSILEFTGGISGPAIRDWSVSDLANWRDEGGLFELDDLQWKTGNLALKATGDLTLDENFRPLGSASVSVSDWQTAQRLLSQFNVRLQTGTLEETSVMMQNGTALIDGEVIRRLPAVIND